ncbi:MAG TPA: hypothetical protein DEP01_02280 [Aminobacterium sp.]|uniref:lipid-binding SYLF domain-containing protein n=1 Tax=Aminobacterium TaxID=81466 RepID=UPI00046747D0|nr:MULTISPECIES: lipid-binding SYLF domain-containing protein [Aminobacterium]HCA40435.1 hypothetical protein [Aminobacterium sp.]
MNLREKHARYGISIIVTLAFLLWSGICAPQQALAKTPEQRISGAVKLLHEMQEQSDVGTMADLLEQAKGVAIFPSVIKAGFVFGGKYGEGLVLRRDTASGRWYGPSFATIAGASWGLQIGAESIGLVLVITNERGLEGFKGNNFKLGGDIGVAAGPVGRRGELGTDIKLKASIYSYSIAKGLFAGMSLEGAAVNVDDNANHVYWGKTITAAQALDRRASSAKIQPLIQALNKLIKEAK